MLLFVLSLLAVSTTQLESKHVQATHHRTNADSVGKVTAQGTQTSTGKGVTSGDSEDCSTSTWLLPKHTSNGSTTCECGSGLGGVVKCNSTTQQVAILQCYCMTYDNDNSVLIAGQCFYGCFTNRILYHYPYISPYYSLPSNTTQLNKVCEEFHRTGQLCGKCMDGFAPPVYSYSSNCVNCTEYGSNWAKYVTVAFLPLTALFVVVVVFRVSATSGRMSVFILVCQTVTTPVAARVYANIHIENNRNWWDIGFSLYGIWNLDFFRLLFSPFCIHPKMTTLQTLALDYAIAVYPLLLIFITYLLVFMHDNFQTVVWLWKPFHACFVGFRKEWNIKGSLINAFATFLLLSYVKFLSVSFELLIPIRIFNMHGHLLSKLYLYYDGTVEYFGKEHLPFGILALIVLTVFNIFPLLLLLLYPCQCFQRCLNRCNIQFQVLHTFMDAFQGCYKDGSNGTRDCRWFAALYLMLRVAFLLVCVNVGVTSEVVFPILIILVSIPAFLTAVFQPHKYRFHNMVDVFLLLVFVSFLATIMAVIISQSSAMHSATISGALVCIFSPIPLFYLISVLLYKLLAHKGCVQKACQRICELIPYNFRATDFGGALPDRIVHASEYTPLLLSEPTERTVAEQHSEPEY
jgi:hypothetical protein